MVSALQGIPRRQARTRTRFAADLLSQRLQTFAQTGGALSVRQEEVRQGFRERFARAQGIGTAKMTHP